MMQVIIIMLYYDNITITEIQSTCPTMFINQGWHPPNPTRKKTTQKTQDFLHKVFFI